MGKLVTMSLAAVLAVSSLTGCTSGEGAGSAGGGAKEGKDLEDIYVGVSLGSSTEERWAREAKMFEEYAEEQGFKISVQSANNEVSLQVSQCENMINDGIDVLLLQALDAAAVSPIIDEAHDAGIQVISYDRLAMECDVDYYITFDSVKVGEIEAQFVVDQAPKGNYIWLKGGPEDNNAVLVAEGQKNILQPYIDSGDINVVLEQWCDGWDPNKALEYTENGLTACSNDLQGLIASNDGTCGGAIEALAEQGMAGEVPTCGQDADLAACQRIIAGTQTGTVFKPTPTLNQAACELAVAIATGEVTDDAQDTDCVDSSLGTWGTLNNNYKDVTTFNVDVIAVDKDNLYDVVIKEYGYQTVEDVYANVDKSEWPAEE